MRVRIKRFSKKLPLPRYQTEGAAAFDLAAREAVTIAPGEVGYVPLNVVVATPPGHVLLVVPRSGTHKRGLILANGVGVGDPDFCGDGDEYRAAYLNITKTPVTVGEGERIAQGLLVRAERVEWEEVDTMPHPDRGGFGGTGSR